MEDLDRIIKVEINETMKKSYIDYSMSVIVARALPEVRDGFKPVHRRLLDSRDKHGETSVAPTRRRLCIWRTGAFGAALGNALHAGGRTRQLRFSRW